MNKQVSRMEQVVQSYVADKQFMGSILVAQQGHVLLDKGYGYLALTFHFLTYAVVYNTIKWLV